MAEQNEPLGAESSAAVAEAAEAVKEPSFTEALSAFAREQAGGSASDVEREAEAPAADATAKPAEAETAGDDYNPEDHAEEPPKDEVETKPADAPDGEAWPEDIKKTWDQYPNERERAKALAENKRYGIEQAERAKKLEAELAELRAKGGTAAAPTPESTEAPAPTTRQPLNAEPTVEDVRAVIDRLSQEDPVVARAVETLGNQRAELVQKHEALKTLRTEIQTAESEHAELVANIKYLEKKLAGRPDDFAIQEELEDVRDQARKLATQIDSKFIRSQRLDGELTTLDNRYRYGLDALKSIGASEHARTRAKEESDRTFTERRDKEAKTWTDSFSAFATELKIPKDLHQEVNDIMLLKATHHDGDIEDVPAWLRDNAGIVRGLLDKHRASVLAEYGDDKRADATQPAPKGPAAVAPARETRPMSSRDADRLAGRQMREAFTRR